MLSYCLLIEGSRECFAVVFCCKSLLFVEKLIVVCDGWESEKYVFFWPESQSRHFCYFGVKNRCKTSMCLLRGVVMPFFCAFIGARFPCPFLAVFGRFLSD
jgi:hypothetical protein